MGSENVIIFSDPLIIFVALYIYRHLTVVEKNKAGYWFRLQRFLYTHGLLKRAKKKERKENFPPAPLL